MAAALSTGCATIFRGSHQTVHFESNPTGADVTDNGRYLGATPIDGEVRRSTTANVKIAKNGYTEERAGMQKHLSAGWLLFDLAVCPVSFCIPALVDAITGSWYGYEDSYAFKLTPLPQAPAQTPATATQAQAPATPAAN